MIDKTQAKKLLTYLQDVGNRCNRTSNGAERVLHLLGYDKARLKAVAEGQDNETRFCQCYNAHCPIHGASYDSNPGRIS